ncbi:MAG: hypothetical protein LLG20_03905 [Acidobacteriales bacterium]|nr:hypothetical protein [Terriglobales bacterium]
MTLTELQAARDKALAALVKAQQVSSGATSVTQRSVEQLQKSIAILDREIAAASSTSTSVIGVLYSREGL